jgi:hypothetical protein
MPFEGLPCPPPFEGSLFNAFWRLTFNAFWRLSLHDLLRVTLLKTFRGFGLRSILKARVSSLSLIDVFYRLTPPMLCAGSLSDTFCDRSEDRASSLLDVSYR